MLSPRSRCSYKAVFIDDSRIIDSKVDLEEVGSDELYLKDTL